MMYPSESLKKDMRFILKIYQRKGGFKACIKHLVKLLYQTFDYMDYYYKQYKELKVMYDELVNSGSKYDTEYSSQYNPDEAIPDELVNAYKEAYEHQYITGKEDLKVI